MIQNIFLKDRQRIVERSFIERQLKSFKGKPQ
jgi:hypothetical protein